MILAAVSRSTFRSVRSSSTKVSSFGLNRPSDSIRSTAMANVVARSSFGTVAAAAWTTLGIPYSLIRSAGVANTF